MSIDEAIEKESKIAKENQKIADTQIVFGNVSISELYCDDTEVIEEHLSNYKKCAEYHEQIAEWLEDYKHIKQWKSDIMDSFCKYDVSSFEELIANARNKAIDDFVERLTTYLGIENATKYGNKNAEQMRNSYGTFMNYEIAESIEDVAEQLKAGVTND